jgi:hypothetical protein
MRRPRIVGWQREFWKTLEVERNKPFVWGERDCIMFGSIMADTILENPCFVRMAKSRFAWSTAREAARILRDTSMKEAIESVLGPSTKWQLLGMGDLVLCEYEDPDLIFDSCLGVHDGTNPIVVGDRRLIVERWSNVICGWKV